MTHSTFVLTLILLTIMALNLPFGYWRAGVRKFSVPWFVAIHVPVVLAIGLRWVCGIPFQLSTLPLFVAAFFSGQLLGGRLRNQRTKKNKPETMTY